MLDRSSAPSPPYYAVIFTRIRSAEGSGFARTGEDPIRQGSNPSASASASALAEAADQDRVPAPSEEETLPDYAETAERMLELAEGLDGYLGMDSLASASGEGITISYWRDEAAIAAWRRNADHRAARANGRKHWYQWWRVRVAKVEREYASTDKRPS